jgi:hypothetical protein
MEAKAREELDRLLAELDATCEAAAALPAEGRRAIAERDALVQRLRALRQGLGRWLMRYRSPT